MSPFRHLRIVVVAMMVVGAVSAVPGAVGAVPLAGEFAGPIHHDAVSRLSGSLSADEARFLPLFTVENGCHPYASVQDDGAYNGGLQNSGDEAGECAGNGTGQAIVRTRCESSGICAHMYALYFPKDQGMVEGVSVPGLGHRNEWENLVAWVRNGRLVAASFSRHSGYDIKGAAELLARGAKLSVRYGTDGDVTHSFQPGDGRGSPMPSPVSLDTVTAAARHTLNAPGTWGGIDFPERDDNFAAKLAKARPSWLT